MAELPEGTIMSLSNLRVITFYNNEQKQVGQIDFNGRKIVFEGDIHDSANSLFIFIRDIIDPFFNTMK